MIQKHSSPPTNNPTISKKTPPTTTTLKSKQISSNFKKQKDQKPLTQPQQQQQQHLPIPSTSPVPLSKPKPNTKTAPNKKATTKTTTSFTKPPLSPTSPKPTSPPPSRPQKTLHLRVRHNVGYGRSVYALGNINPLGNWQISCAQRMTWTSNDIWTLEIPLNSTSSNNNNNNNHDDGGGGDDVDNIVERMNGMPDLYSTHVSAVEYKYGVVVEDQGRRASWEWEIGENHVIATNNLEQDYHGGPGGEATGAGAGAGASAGAGAANVVDVWGGGGGIFGKDVSHANHTTGELDWGQEDEWGGLGGKAGGEPPPTPNVGVGKDLRGGIVKSALERLGRDGGEGLLEVVGGLERSSNHGRHDQFYGNGFMDMDGKAGNENTKCLVFKMKYHTVYGENVYVVGGIDELGGWNKEKAVKLKYQKNALTPGLWEVPVMIARDDQHKRFEYKYFVLDQHGERKWENGDNRVARPFRKSQHEYMNGFAKGVSPDLPVSSTCRGDASGKNNPERSVRAETVETEDCPENDWDNDSVDDEKHVLLLDDRWEKIRMEFSIFFPTEQGESMYITGDPLELGAWFKPGPMPMQLGEKQKLETNVDGQKWIKAIYVDPSVVKFSYRYIVINEDTKKEIWEREPNRRAQFEGEKPYNSVFVCRDVNFVGGMKFDKVPPNMFIGPYPQTVDDIEKLHKSGVTAIFNVQTDQDFQHRGIQWDVLTAKYNALDIEICRYPITDFDGNSLYARLLGAAKLLDDLISRGKQVYIHCTAGMGRAPASAVAYLCWAKKWDLDDAVTHVKKFRTVAVPNVPVLRRALAEFDYDTGKRIN